MANYNGDREINYHLKEAFNQNYWLTQRKRVKGYFSCLFRGEIEKGLLIFLITPTKRKLTSKSIPVIKYFCFCQLLYKNYYLKNTYLLLGNSKTNLIYIISYQQYANWFTNRMFSYIYCIFPLFNLTKLNVNNHI